MRQVNIYTDGACYGNQDENNLGGWGAVLQFGPHEKEIWERLLELLSPHEYSFFFIKCDALANVYINKHRDGQVSSV